MEFIFTEDIKSVRMKYRKGHGGHLLYSAVCGPWGAAEREGAAGDWRNLHSKDRRDLYMPPNFIRVIKEKEEWDGRGIWRPWGKGEFGAKTVRKQTNNII